VFGEVLRLADIRIGVCVMDWEEEIKKVQKRECENVADFANVNVDYNMNYVGEWGVPGFTTSGGKLLSHNDLWEFCHSYKYMQKLANLRGSDGDCLVSHNKPRVNKCLELGCDWGHNFVTLKSCFEEVYGVDINETSVATAKERGNNVVCCMMEHTSFEDNMFDLVISNQTLEHGVSAEVTLKEIYRVTKPGGYSIHTMPCWQSMYVEPESIIHKTCLNYLQGIEKCEAQGCKRIRDFWGWNQNMEDWTIIAQKVSGDE